MVQLEGGPKYTSEARGWFLDKVKDFRTRLLHNDTEERQKVLQRVLKLQDSPDAMLVEEFLKSHRKT